MYSDFESISVYSITVSIAGAALVIQSIFSTVWAPIVYKLALQEGGDIKIFAITRYVTLAVVIAFSLGGLFSWVVPLFLPEEYYEVEYLLPACLGYPLLYALSEATMVGLGVARRSGLTMLAAIVALMVNVVGNYLFVPKYGASGAAGTTALTFFIFLVLRTEFSCRVWKPFARSYVYGFSLAAVLLSLLGLYAGTNRLVVQTLWIGLLVFTCLYFRAELISILRFFYSRFFLFLQRN